jgi:F-box/leucine-rich repeat protein 2/20
MEAFTILDLFAGLPEELFSSLLSRWLTATSFARLDSALCVRDHRAWLLQVAYGPTVVLSRPSLMYIPPCVCRQAMMVWLMRRNVGMEWFDVSNCTLDNVALSGAYLEARGSTVLTVDFSAKRPLDDDYTALNKTTCVIGKFCAKLRTFHGNHGHSLEALATIAEGCVLLETLNLRGEFADATLNAFARNCHHLRKVTIHSHDSVPSAVSVAGLAQHCRYLHTLHICLKDKVLTDAFLGQLAPCCSQLEELDVSSAHVSHVGLEALAVHCGKLRSLSFCNGSITAAAPVNSASLCALRSLTIYAVEIENESLDSLLGFCPTVEVLWIAHQQSLTEAGYVAIAQRCPLIQDLTLQGGGPAVTDTVLRSVAEQYRHLRAFCVTDCGQITDAGLTTLLQGHPQLEQLDIRDNWKLTDAALHAVSVSCTHLRRIVLGDCYGMTDVGVLALLEGCPQLTSVDVEDYCGLTEETKRLLKERFRTKYG